MSRPLLPLLALLAAGLAAPGFAQTSGGPVPEGAPPPIPPPVRDGTLMAEPAAPGSQFARHGAIPGFAEAYRRKGRPRMALYWNESLASAYSEWTSDVRLVERHESSRYGSGQTVTELQYRVPPEQRRGASESFDWEFQDGFLGPFLAAGVSILDRGAIVELTGSDPRNFTSSPDGRALKAKADYLLEVLMAANSRSTTGYEMRVRILDIRTGAILAIVNTRSLPDWNRDQDDIEITPNGYRLRDPDDDRFGPTDDRRFVAGPNGYVERRRPPRPFRIGEDLARSTMSTLMQHWR